MFGRHIFSLDLLPGDEIFQLIPREGGGRGRGSPQMFGWGCAARFSKPWPYVSDPFSDLEAMSLVNVKITREVNEHVPCQNHNLFQTKKAKTIPYFRLKQLENHTLKCGTYPYSLYIGVPPPPVNLAKIAIFKMIACFAILWCMTLRIGPLTSPF